MSLFSRDCSSSLVESAIIALDQKDDSQRGRWSLSPRLASAFSCQVPDNHNTKRSMLNLWSCRIIHHVIIHASYYSCFVRSWRSTSPMPNTLRFALFIVGFAVFVVSQA